MKRIALIVLGIVLLLGTSSFVLNFEKKANVVTGVQSNFYASKPETLANDMYQQSLCLYTDGTCYVQTTEGGGYGKYDLLYSGLIKINWDNGAYQEGTFVKIRDVNGITRIKSVTVNGVTYTNKERFVVPRS